MKRIFLMPGMPVDDSTKAGVKDILSGLENDLVRLAQQSLDRLTANFRVTPSPRPLASEIDTLAAAVSSKIDLLFYAANASKARQVVFRAGQLLDANLVLREIFGSAESSIDISDPYLGSRFFALLTEKRKGVTVRILSASVKPADCQGAADFKQQYGGLELRAQKSGMHDRFIIVDRSAAYAVGHSLKNLGSKDTAVTEAPDPSSVVKLFEDRWNAAQTCI